MDFSPFFLTQLRFLSCHGRSHALTGAVQGTGSARTSPRVQSLFRTPGVLRLYPADNRRRRSRGAEAGRQYQKLTGAASTHQDAWGLVHCVNTCPRACASGLQRWAVCCAADRFTAHRRIAISPKKGHARQRDRRRFRSRRQQHRLLLAEIEFTPADDLPVVVDAIGGSRPPSPMRSGFGTARPVQALRRSVRIEAMKNAKMVPPNIKSHPCHVVSIRNPGNEVSNSTAAPTFLGN